MREIVISSGESFFVTNFSVNIKQQSIPTRMWLLRTYPLHYNNITILKLKEDTPAFRNISILVNKMQEKILAIIY